MNTEINGILKEISKILKFHKILGIEDYPATEAFHKKKADSLTTTQSTKNSTDSPIVAPLKNIKRLQKNDIPGIQAVSEDCERCGLHKTRTNIIFGEGNPEADIMIIGPAPSEQADHKMSLYADEPGKLLANMLKAINLAPADVYYTTLVKCKTLNKMAPAQMEIRACHYFLVRQIEAVNPKIIWTIGAEAGQTLLKSSRSIFQLRGQFHEYKGIPLMATFHPETLLENNELKKPTWTDMQMIQKKLVTASNKRKK